MELLWSLISGEHPATCLGSSTFANPKPTEQILSLRKIRSDTQINFLPKSCLKAQRCFLSSAVMSQDVATGRKMKRIFRMFIVKLLVDLNRPVLEELFDAFHSTSLQEFWKGLWTMFTSTSFSPAQKLTLLFPWVYKTLRSSAER